MILHCVKAHHSDGKGHRYATLVVSLGISLSVISGFSVFVCVYIPAYEIFSCALLGVFDHV